MVRKISVKTSTNSIKHLNKNNNLITDLKEISNTLAENFSHNSSLQQYTQTFQQLKQIKEKQPINFKSKNLENYNTLFSMREFTRVSP